MQRVLFVKQAQALGFSLKEIKELLSLRATPRTRCEDVHRRAELKIHDIDEKRSPTAAVGGALIRRASDVPVSAGQSEPRQQPACLSGLPSAIGWSTASIQCCGRDAASRLLLSRLKDRGDRGAVGRAAADIVESHSARRIDEDIAAELSRVRAGVSRQPAVREFFRISQPRPGSPDVPQMSPVHAVAAVQRAVVVDENGPGDLRFRDVCTNERRALERHHDNPRPEILECPFVLLQLQQVPAAGESTEVPMEHQQEPMTLVIGEAVCAPLGIEQFERNRRPANLTSSNPLCHASTP